MASTWWPTFLGLSCNAAAIAASLLPAASGSATSLTPGQAVRADFAVAGVAAGNTPLAKSTALNHRVL